MSASSAGVTPPASRNAPCPCGSGKRYKECHGAVAAPLPAAPGPLAATLARALSAQHAGHLDSAESLYRAALTMAPDNVDALHMLAVVCLMRGAASDARLRLMRALELTGWKVAAMRTNLGLVLAAMLKESSAHDTTELAARYAAMRAGRLERRHAVQPKVSVVLPSYNHARFVEEALRSVFAQDYPAIELVVIDDGSWDGSAAVVERVLADAPMPARFVRRVNKGAHATLNEGLELADGDFVQFLNSDDSLAPSRIRRMVDEVASSGAQWGFSAVDLIDAHGGRIDPARHPRGAAIVASIASIDHHETVGLAFLASNPAVSSGNLFVARDFARQLGGFADHRYNHDWDFCLRALVHSEPVFVPGLLYCYRLHGSNTIDESSDAARAEAHGIVAAFLARVMGGEAIDNPFAPSPGRTAIAFERTVLGGGMAGLLDPAALERLAARLDFAERSPCPPSR